MAVLAFGSYLGYRFKEVYTKDRGYEVLTLAVRRTGDRYDAGFSRLPDGMYLLWEWFGEGAADLPDKTGCRDDELSEFARLYCAVRYADGEQDLAELKKQAEELRDDVQAWLEVGAAVARFAKT